MSLPEFVTCKNCGKEEIPYGTDRCPDCKALVKGSPTARKGGREKPTEKRAAKLLEEFGYADWGEAPEHIKLLAERAVKGGQGDLKTFLQQMEELKPAPRQGQDKVADVTKIVITADTVEGALGTMQHLKDYIVEAERIIGDEVSS